MADVVALGELLIDFVSTVNGASLAEAPAFQKAPGGAPANVAVGLVRLGVTSGFLGKVGDDPFGHFLAATLAAEGIDVAGLRFAAAARTALAFVSLGADGERDFVFFRHPSADMLYRPDEVDAGVLAGARILHIGSISLISEPSRSATLHAVELAQASGAWVSFDPNLRLNLWPNADAARAGMREGWGRANIIKIGVEELEFLVGAHGGAPVETARALWHDGLRLVVVTNGGAGCQWITPDASGEVPGFKVETVDTTGAGDGFVAGLLRGLLHTPDALSHPTRLTEVCRFANAVGALTTTQRGAIPALPTATAVSAFLGQQVLPPEA